MKTKLMILILSACTFSMAQAANEQLKADKDQVNAACSADAQTAGCGGEVVGKGLLKCLHGYKKAHKEFKFSDGCKSAMKTMKSDRAHAKAEKSEGTVNK
jgi:hypothetical protein